MEIEPKVQPLPYRHRKWAFGLLLCFFILSLPFLYLYATGYRFDFLETNLVSTGGVYIAVEETGADIFIDDELVRDTRVFRRAFYAQGITPGTHRVHVQLPGYHTWVKELPVSPHLVTEALSFNLPLLPEARVLSEWQTEEGAAVVATTSLLVATTTNDILATSTLAISTLERSTEYLAFLRLFATTSATSTETLADRVLSQIETLLDEATSTPTTTTEVATTTKVERDVRLYETDEGIFAEWIGSLEDMPYYYCAEDFEPYSTSTEKNPLKAVGEEITANTAELLHPVQTVDEDAACDPTIQIHTQFQEASAFDFFPGSTDLVVMALEDGVYVIEIDNRAWQNVQPLILGEGLDMRVENGQIYVYDGNLIYQMILET